MGHYYDKFTSIDAEKSRNRDIVSTYKYNKNVLDKYTDDPVKDAILYILEKLDTRDAKILSMMITNTLDKFIDEFNTQENL